MWKLIKLTISNFVSTLRLRRLVRKYKLEPDEETKRLYNYCQRIVDKKWTFVDTAEDPISEAYVRERMVRFQMSRLEIAQIIMKTHSKIYKNLKYNRKEKK